jgi:hypothetical protein
MGWQHPASGWYRFQGLDAVPRRRLYRDHHVTVCAQHRACTSLLSTRRIRDRVGVCWSEARLILLGHASQTRRE